MAWKEWTFKAGSPCLWTWPLLLARASRASDSTLLPVHSDFAHLVRVVDGFGENRFVSLILFEEGLDEAEQYLERDFPESGNLASFVLILEPDPGKILSAGKPEDAFRQKLHNLARGFHASGITCLSKPQTSGWFLTDLIVQLSHNRSLPQVLRDLRAHGAQLVDPKLERETRLDHLLAGIIEELRYGPLSDEWLDIHSRLLPGPWHGSGAQLADRLAQDMVHYQFDQERKEASGLAEVTQVLYQKEDPGRFNQINEGYYQSGPPDSVATEEEEMEASPEGGDGFSGSEAADEVYEESGEEPMSEAGPEDDFPDSAPPPPPPSAPPARPPVAPPSHRGHKDKPKEANTPNARYLQAQIAVSGEEPPENPPAFLAPRTAFDLRIRIGRWQKAWSAGAEAFPDKTVFKPDQKEAEQIKLVYKDNFSSDPQEDVLLVRPTGDSPEAWFTFTTKQASRHYLGIVSAYHRNRLVQELEISIPVADPARPPVGLPSATFTTVHSLAPTENLKDRQDFRLCIQVATDGRPDALSGLVENKPVTLRYNQALRDKTARIQALIESTVDKEASFPPDLLHKNNARLLRQLAVLGHELYTAWKTDLGALQGPIQLVIGPDEFFPLEFLYSGPLPDKKAPVCPQAAEALDKGVCCGQCDTGADTSPVVCPFGFAGIREIIERTGGLLPPGVAPAGGQRVLPARQSVLFGATEKVQEVQAGLVAGMETAVKKEFEKTWVAPDWKTWKKHVQNAPRSLILVVHTETSVDDQREELEIGVRDLLAKTVFVSSHLRAGADAPPPLAVIIGCRTGDPQQHGFDIGSLALRNGAALVFSNFTKILGRQAAPVITSLARFIGEQRGKEARFGDIERRLRQHLLARGIMVGLTLVAHGDADWKLKL